MGNTKTKSLDLFDDLLASELPATSTQNEDLFAETVEDSFSKPSDRVPPPPAASKLVNLKKEFKVDKGQENFSTADSPGEFTPDYNQSESEDSADNVFTIESERAADSQVTAEGSFEDEFKGVEASEIFPMDSAIVRMNSDKTQKLPMADPFDVSESEIRSKPLPKNVVDLQDHLKSSNYLEVAQNRVLELEKEIQKLRRDSEQLAAAGKHFKEMNESLKMQVKQAESNYQNMQDIAKEEKKILMQSLEAKEIKISALQERVVDVEQRQGSQYENVRVRERELENRLEIMKSETEALAHSKDEMILELKKQVQVVHSDLEKYRIQNQKMSTKIENKEELLRRTVKALRIALTMLEGSNLDEE